MKDFSDDSGRPTHQSLSIVFGIAIHVDLSIVDKLNALPWDGRPNVNKTINHVYKIVTTFHIFWKDSLARCFF